jgi:hypothetical protein
VRDDPPYIIFTDISISRNIIKGDIGQVVIIVLFISFRLTHLHRPMVVHFKERERRRIEKKARKKGKLALFK